MIWVPLLLVVKQLMFTTYKKSEDVSYIIWAKPSTHNKLLVKKLLVELTKKEETHWDVSTQVHILCMLLLVEFLVHMFGNMVLRRLNIMLILILLIMSQLLKKNKCKLRMKLIKSFFKLIQFLSILRTKRLLNKSMDSISIKVVLFLVTLSELLILKVLMLRHVVVLMLITLQKLVGLKSSSQPESVMVSSDFITWQVKKLWRVLMKKLLLLINLKICGESTKMKSSQQLQDSSMIIKSSKNKHKVKKCHF